MSYSAIIVIKLAMADGQMFHIILYSKYCRCEMQQCCVNLRLIMGIKIRS